MKLKGLLFLFFALAVIGCQICEEWKYPGFLWGFAVHGFPITDTILSNIENETKFEPEIILFYLQWSKPSQTPEPLTPSLETIWKHNSVPCITWEPMFIDSDGEHIIPFQDILNGIFDPYLSIIAEEIAKWQKPVIIRFAHEMNLDRYHWGYAESSAFDEKAPENYIKMYRYVVEYFKRRKVSNILWVFSPNVDSIPNHDWNRAMNYYPSDPYVDLLGMDGYNWGDSTSRSFEAIFYPLYKELKTAVPKKPIFVFETGTASPGKDFWIESAYQTAQNWGVKGIIWFQVKKEHDWRMNEGSDYSYLRYLKSDPRAFQKWITQYIQTKESR